MSRPRLAEASPPNTSKSHALLCPSWDIAVVSDPNWCVEVARRSDILSAEFVEANAELFGLGMRSIDFCSYNRQIDYAE